MLRFAAVEICKKIAGEGTKNTLAGKNSGTRIVGPKITARRSRCGIHRRKKQKIRKES